ncbi:MAG: type II toxin-antitoxin system RelE/ParE family toxin [Elusimicrobia bacterium]|nr:type II toxin-antitoxin system RelE/ParE family toxin [Elusimicrobiota bacterium]
MIYNNNGYKIKYYKDFNTGKVPVKIYIDNLSEKEQAKIFKYLEYLKQSEGYLDEPYSRHIKGKIRELRVDFSNNRHRIFYFTFINKNIILLHAFLKKTKKTPKREVKKAEGSYKQLIINKNVYE